LNIIIGKSPLPHPLEVIAGTDADMLPDNVAWILLNTGAVFSTPTVLQIFPTIVTFTLRNSPSWGLN